MAREQLLQEKLVPLGVLARTTNVPRSYSTVRIWATRGIKGCRGQVVILETIPISGIKHTSLEAFRRFLREQAGFD